MTTIILASKLLSVRADESKLEKIQHLKSCVMKEKNQINRAIRELMNKQKGFKTCRLCLRVADRKIFNNETDFNIAEDIKNLLNIEINENDRKPQYICNECESIICKTVELKQTAELSQWRLEQELQTVSESTCDGKSEDINDYTTDIGTENIQDVKLRHCKTQKMYSSQGKFELQEKKQRKAKQGAYICETCGLKLKTMWRLKTHRLTHTNEFHYSCPHCPYRARTTYSLQIHERIHTGDKPYRCGQCSAMFVSASNLASHRRSHLPPAYICDTCHKGFKFKEPLLNHIASQHRSAKPFYCATCGKAFATRKLLRRHERRMHNRPKMRVGATPSYIKTQEEIMSDI